MKGKLVDWPGFAYLTDWWIKHRIGVARLVLQAVGTYAVWWAVAQIFGPVVAGYADSPVIQAVILAIALIVGVCVTLSVWFLVAFGLCLLEPDVKN